MTNKEFVNRNIGLTFDFVHHLMDNPKQMENLPEKFNLEFIEKDFTKVEYLSEDTHKDPSFTKKYVKVENKFEIPR